MIEHLLPVAFALFIWWFSTGAIVYLDGLPKRTFLWSLSAATALLLVALYVMIESGKDTSVEGAYLAFTAGLVIWAWLEMAFYTGVITGPRRSACPDTHRGWLHFWHAIETVLWNQIATALTFLVMLAMLWEAPNKIALWTFLVLWWMQQSAKLNVYLGVRNLNEHFLPRHLDYLRHYMRRRPLNMFFPFSVSLSTIVFVLIVRAAHSPDISAGEATGLGLVATILGLAILEHWFLVLPIPAEKLWDWSLASHRQQASDTEQIAPLSEKGSFAPSGLAESAGGPREMTQRSASSPGQGTFSGQRVTHKPTWSTTIDGECDQHALSQLLAAIASGGFGRIDVLDGVARSGATWVRFRVADGRAHIIDARSEARANEEPLEFPNGLGRARAFGTAPDGPRLQAAFAACVTGPLAT
ncbi:MAG: putative photosynthetic complex assembly protein PuhE [Hyphomicrobiaceae bacterium]